MTAPELLAELRRHANPANVAGMARFGINPKKTLGVGIPFVRALGKRAGKSHVLAAELWASGIHEARILASLVEEPAMVTERQMDAWARDFDSWDVCDQVCMNLFDKTPFAYGKAVRWAGEREAFVKRAGFALMAALTSHDKQAPDGAFYPFFPCIRDAAGDDRNFVKKAVNWALRQLGKRRGRKELARRARALAAEFAVSPSPSARWIGRDALREFDAKGL